MLDIIVLGSGLIPRGNGIAPRRDPFKADKATIRTILLTNGLKPYFRNPNNGKFSILTMANYEKTYDMFDNKAAKPVFKTPEVKEVKVQEPVKKEEPVRIPEDVVKEIAKETVQESFDKPEEKKEENAPLVPVNNPNNNGNNNGNYNNNKHKK